MWTGISALELGVPLTLIGEAVFARCLSSLNEERLQGEKLLGTPTPPFEGDRSEAVSAIHDALYASKIISYTQGYMLMREAAAAHGWNLQYGDIALMWRGAASFAAVFSTISRRRSAANRISAICCLTPSSPTPSRGLMTGWRKRSPWVSARLFPYPPSVALSPSSTATGAAASRPICCRPSGLLRRTYLRTDRSAPVANYDCKLSTWYNRPVVKLIAH